MKQKFRVKLTSERMRLKSNENTVQNNCFCIFFVILTKIRSDRNFHHFYIKKNYCFFNKVDLFELDCILSTLIIYETQRCVKAVGK